MEGRLLAIGDVHGEWEKLQSLYEKICFNPEKDRLVFLGDYIDRGPEPMKVLDWVMEMAKLPQVVALRGNHEEMMRTHFEDAWDVEWLRFQSDWINNGGKVTRRHLQNVKKRQHPLRDYLAFIKELPYSYETEAGGRKFFFCHAGVDPEVPLAEQEPHTLLWIREEFYEYYEGDTVVVAGHTPVQEAFGEETPVINEHFIMVDTGAFFDEGRLSCVDVLTGTFWQSDAW